VLYVGTDREALDQDSFNLLKRFSERVGIVASLAIAST
jgi:hypothetical protein